MESSKGKKERKRRLHEEKGGKSHKDLYVSYHAIDEPSLAANVFRPPKFSSQHLLDHGKFTSLHCSNYHDVQKITILPQTESRKGKEKETDLSLPHWGKDLFILRTPDS
jgi:hypothetical protein